MSDICEGFWTTEKPKEAGWYRVRGLHSDNPDDRMVVEWNGTSTWVIGSAMEWMDEYTNTWLWDHRRIDFLPVPEGE